ALFVFNTVLSAVYLQLGLTAN
ncbi:MAG: hypothetical protein QOF00_5849, partial [Pseudonocardiales bacterium]|nr:hypothetical protein [Pseudonocardiales bacterium]